MANGIVDVIIDWLMGCHKTKNSNGYKDQESSNPILLLEGMIFDKPYNNKMTSGHIKAFPKKRFINYRRLC